MNIGAALGAAVGVIAQAPPDPNELILSNEISDNYICGLNGFAKFCFWGLFAFVGCFCGASAITLAIAVPPLGVALHLFASFVLVVAGRFFVSFERQLFWITNSNADGFAPRMIFCITYFGCIFAFAALALVIGFTANEVDAAITFLLLAVISCVQLFAYTCYGLAYTDAFRDCGDCFTILCLDQQAIAKKKAEKAARKARKAAMVRPPPGRVAPA